MKIQKNQSNSESLLGNDSHSLGSTRLWIAFLSLFLVALNIIVFVIYQQSHSTEDSWEQLWNYSNSEPFKVLTISLILPILILFLENLFSLRKILGERLFEMKKVRLKREEEAKKKGLEVRWKVIEKTSKALNELFSLISELRYFRKDSNEESKKTSIRDILRRIENTSISINEIMNRWYFRFPNLRHEKGELHFIDLVVYFLRLLTDSAFTIADHIQGSSDPKELEELQNTLFEIQCGVRSLVYHNTLMILKCSIDIWESTEDKNKVKIEEAEKEIKERLESLKTNAKWIWEEELEHNEVLSNARGSGTKAFREKSREVEKCACEHPEEDIKLSKEYRDCEELFKKIKHKDLARCPRQYSLEWVRVLSDILRQRSMCIYILERAKWARYKELNPSRKRPNSCSPKN